MEITRSYQQIMMQYLRRVAAVAMVAGVLASLPVV